MLYILSGEDDFSITRELESIKKSIGDSGMLDTNTNILDGKQVPDIALGDTRSGVYIGLHSSRDNVPSIGS